MQFWLAFLAANIVTWIAQFSLWMMPSYFMVLAVLATLSLVLGIIVIVKNQFAKGSLVFVILLLGVGQWWLIELLLMQVLWATRGFAP